MEFDKFFFFGAKNGVFMPPKVSNHATHGNGNGHGDSPPRLKTVTRGDVTAHSAVAPKSAVTFQMSGGFEIRGTPVHLTRHRVAFEIPGADAGLRASEVLNGFKIIAGGRTVFQGRAVVSGLHHAGARVVCEATLDEGEETKIPFAGNAGFLDAYHTFFGKWQNQAKLPTEFKTAVFDLQSYLSDLKLLLGRMETAVAASASSNRAEMESRVFHDLSPAILSSVDALHRRFEIAAGKISPDAREAAQTLVHRRLHPLFLCAPFGHRTYHKPLGHAGDYEIMNMIHRNTFEGESWFAKMVHYWLVNQWAAKSVRNRVAYMKAALASETARIFREKRPARILNLGCGPAREVREFISESPLADRAEFTLVDFDAETIDYVASTLAEANRRHERRAQIQTRRVSVAQLIKNMSSPSQKPAAGFDLIYCGGLFDYLTDQTCRQLVHLFYEWLAPGGRIIAANMNHEHKPFHQMVEYLLDWHLIYRGARDLASFAPEAASADDWSVVSEPLAVNFFLEVRKPEKTDACP